MDHFHLLIKDCWEQIFLRLDNPQDKINLARSSPLLESVFRTSQEDWIFFAALPVFMRSLHQNFGRGVTEQTLFLFRQLSIDTCLAMDRFIENCWNCQSGAEEDTSGPIFPLMFAEQGHFYCGCDNKLKTFLKDIQGHPTTRRNPLLGRYASFYVSENNNDCSKEDFLTCLEKIGGYLSSFEVAFDGDADTMQRNFCKTMFSSLSNVISLSIGWKSVCSSIRNDAQEELLLPDLPKLKKLVLRGFQDNALPKFLSFRNQFSQLVYFFVHFPLWKEEYNRKGLFPNLQVFRLEMTEDLLKLTVRGKLFKLLSCLDSSALRKLHFGRTFIRWNNQGIKKEDAIRAVDKMTFYFLRKHQPKSKWKRNEAITWAPEYIRVK